MNNARMVVGVSAHRAGYGPGPALPGQPPLPLGRSLRLRGLPVLVRAVQGDRVELSSAQIGRVLAHGQLLKWKGFCWRVAHLAESTATLEAWGHTYLDSTKLLRYM